MHANIIVGVASCNRLATCSYAGRVHRGSVIDFRRLLSTQTKEQEMGHACAGRLAKHMVPVILTYFKGATVGMCNA